MYKLYSVRVNDLLLGPQISGAILTLRMPSVCGQVTRMCPGSAHLLFGCLGRRVLMVPSLPSCTEMLRVPLCLVFGPLSRLSFPF